MFKFIIIALIIFLIVMIVLNTMVLPMIQDRKESKKYEPLLDNLKEEATKNHEERVALNTKISDVEQILRETKSKIN